MFRTAVEQSMCAGRLGRKHFAFLGRYRELDSLEEKPYYFCLMLLELALLDFSLVRYAPSMQAAAALFLVNKIFNRGAWRKQLLVETVVLCNEHGQAGKFIHMPGCLGGFCCRAGRPVFIRAC